MAGAPQHDHAAPRTLGEAVAGVRRDERQPCRALIKARAHGALALAATAASWPNPLTGTANLADWQAWQDATAPLGSPQAGA